MRKYVNATGNRAVDGMTIVLRDTEPMTSWLLFQGIPNQWRHDHCSKGYRTNDVMTIVLRNTETMTSWPLFQGIPNQWRHDHWSKGYLTIDVMAIFLRKQNLWLHDPDIKEKWAIYIYSTCRHVEHGLTEKRTTARKGICFYRNRTFDVKNIFTYKKNLVYVKNMSPYKKETLFM